MTEVILVFKKTSKDLERKYNLYVLDFLDMKFSISECLKNPSYPTYKVFTGFRQEDLSYIPMRDYRHNFPWAPKDHNVLILNHIKQIVDYIQALYGFESISFRIEDQFHKMIEEWLGA